MSDLISRSEAIEFIDAGHLCNPNEPRWSDNEVVNFLKSRPSAQPETHEERTETHACDLIDRQSAIDWCLEGLNNMPSVQPEPSMEECACCVLSKPERKKGRWIEHNPHKWGLGIVFECSECGEKIDCEPSNFCPNCGADMRGEADEAD